MNNTHIAIVLDRSGSMETLKNEIVGGFNAFLEDQKKVPHPATLTLVQFDNEIDRLLSFEPLDKVKPWTKDQFQPRGCTRLYDAIGLTVNSVKDEIEKAVVKPDKVLVVILTDGLENSSQEYTTDTIKELLEDRQKAGWEFTFIGANQDAILTARGIGLSNAASNITYAATAAGTSDMMRSLSRATNALRCSSDPHATFSYTQADRDAQELNPHSSTSSIGKAVFSEHGHKSGTARAAKLPPKQRSKIAKAAAKARWSRNSV